VLDHTLIFPSDFRGYPLRRHLNGSSLSDVFLKCDAVESDEFFLGVLDFFRAGGVRGGVVSGCDAEALIW